MLHFGPHCSFRPSSYKLHVFFLKEIFLKCLPHLTQRVMWAIVVVCQYTSHFYLLKNNSMDLTQTYHAVTLFIAWHLSCLTEMTVNPNKVYEGENNLENSEVHTKTELHISRNNTPGTLVNKNTNNNTEKISLVSKGKE